MKLTAQDGNGAQKANEQVRGQSEPTEAEGSWPSPDSPLVPGPDSI